MKKAGLLLAAAGTVVLEALIILALHSLFLKLAVSLPALALVVIGLALATKTGPKTGGAVSSAAAKAAAGMAPDQGASAVSPAFSAAEVQAGSASAAIVTAPLSVTTVPTALTVRASPPDTTFYDAALDSLFTNIVTYLNSTSDPMSESLVKIREAITGFLERMRAGQNEFQRSDYATRIHDAVERFRDQLANLTGETAETFKSLSQEVESIGEYMNSIKGLLENIADVAERVHVLSINASIESARAGERGKGFKVISNEIQKLAMETQRIVQDITTTVAVSNRVFASISEAVSSNRGRLLDEMARDSTSYDAVKVSVDRQMREMTELYSNVMGFVNALEIDLKTLSPMAMLHSIVTQEIENLDLATRDFVSVIRDTGADPAALAKAMEPAKASEKIRHRLTTSRELDALEQAVAKCGLSGSIQLQRTNTDIEFF